MQEIAPLSVEIFFFLQRKEGRASVDFFTTSDQVSCYMFYYKYGRL